MTDEGIEAMTIFVSILVNRVYEIYNIFERFKLEHVFFLKESWKKALSKVI